MMHRRRFLGSLTVAGLAAVATPDSGHGQNQSSAETGVPTLVNGSVQVTGSVVLPPPEESGIEHVVVVTMENRSFDHFLGWLPGADGLPPGLVYVDRKGVSHSPRPLAPDFTGCPHPSPDHSYDQSRVAYDDGKMDGFLRAGSNDAYTIGYYTQADLPFYSALAQNYLACDRHFASILGPTLPNPLFQWAAQTDRLDDSVTFSGLPTILDRLSEAGMSHRYFFSNVPFLAMWGVKYIGSSGWFAEFLERAAAGTLPAVSFVDPIYTVLDDGTGNDDHPHAEARNGDAFLAAVFHAVAGGLAWDKTVLIINFDEWGGFFEHVAPPRVTAPNQVDSDEVAGQVLLGFRVPTVVVSPLTRDAATTPEVNHTVFDHTSVLKLIEWRWGVPPLTARDASPLIGNFATALNFSAPNASVPAVPMSRPVLAAPCFENIVGLVTPSKAPAGTSPPKSRTPWAGLSTWSGMNEWRRQLKFPAGR